MSRLLFKLKRRLRALFRKAEMERELDDELRFHLEKEIEQNLARGMSPDEARWTALRSFGGVDQVKEESRDVRGVRFVEEFLQDVRYSLRVLLRKPAFTLTVIITLALGIGANTAIFSLVRGVLLRPLPFNNPERLIGIRESKVGEGHNNPMAWRSFSEFRDKTQTLESVAAYFQSSSDIEHGDGVVSVQDAGVSHNYFKVFGVHPMLGRDFTPEDDQRDAPLTAILSYELWQQLYGGDQGIVGKPMKIDGQSATIIGVMPPAFRFPAETTEVWVPLGFTPRDVVRRDGELLTLTTNTTVTLRQTSLEDETLTEFVNEERIAGVVGWGKTVGMVASLISVDMFEPARIRRTVAEFEATIDRLSARYRAGAPSA